jgi:molybdate transport system substrate-binding protein
MMKGRTLLQRAVAVFAASTALAVATSSGQLLCPRPAEIKVMTSGAFTAAYDRLVPQFVCATKHTVVTVYGASMGSAPGAIPNRLGRGECADVVILAAGALDDLVKNGKVVPGSRVDLARSGIGMVVRKGAPKPDISTVEALKRTLLAARSIAYSDSASGDYLSGKLFPRLGIAEQIKDRCKRVEKERVAAVVARGDAEIGFQQVSELLPVPGVDFVGPLPADAQQVTVFSAGVVIGAKEPDAARALIRFLASPAAAPVIEKTGLSPIALAGDGPPDGWRSLPLMKDGKVDPDWVQVGWGGFAVEGQSLRTECDEKGLGLLLYKREKFGDCQVRVVFKAKDAKSNSGVFVRIDAGILDRVNEKHAPASRDKNGKLTPESLKTFMTASEEERGPWYAVHRGYEVQICDASDPYHRTGAVYSLAKSAAAPAKTPPEWRTMVITLRGDLIEVDLDGKRVTTFDPAGKDVPADRKWFEPKREHRRPAAGYIGLQNHDPGDVVYFKEVSVRPLAKAK